MRALLLFIMFGADALAADTPLDLRSVESLASVFVEGCSGVIIAVDAQYAYGLSCEHCCRGVGQPVTIWFRDRTTATGKWLIEDASSDLALFRVPRSAVLAVAPVAGENPTLDGRWSSAGYPNGAFTQKTVRYADDHYLGNFGERRWQFKLLSGTFGSGDSGGAVFHDGYTVGIQSHFGWLVDGTTTFHAARWPELRDFVQQAKGKLKVPCPPGEKCEPETPVVLPRGERQNSTTFRDEAATKHILALEKRGDGFEKRIAELEAQLLALQGKRPDVRITPDGPDAPEPPKPEKPLVPVAGPPGRDGRDGSNGTNGKPGTVTLVLQLDGKTVETVADIPSGKRVRIPVQKLISEAK